MQKGIKKLAAARIDDQHDPGDMPCRMGAKLGEFGNKHRRQIIDTEKAQILQMTAGLRLAAPRHAGDNDETIGIFLLHTPPPKTTR